MDILKANATKPLEGGASFSLANRLERLAWMVTWTLLARWTPGKFSPWRIFLLRLFGARLDPGAAIAASVRVWLPRHLAMGPHATIGPHVDCYNMAPISVGAYSIVSQRSFLCAGTHDISDPHFQLAARPIAIGERAWVAAEAFVGPGVTIGDGAVLGARAAAFVDLEPWTVYRGNPAVAVKVRRLRSDAPPLTDV